MYFSNIISQYIGKSGTDTPSNLSFFARWLCSLKKSLNISEPMFSLSIMERTSQILQTIKGDDLCKALARSLSHLGHRFPMSSTLAPVSVTLGKLVLSSIPFCTFYIFPSPGLCYPKYVWTSPRPIPKAHFSDSSSWKHHWCS